MEARERFKEIIKLGDEYSICSFDVEALFTSTLIKVEASIKGKLLYLTGIRWCLKNGFNLR